MINTSFDFDHFLIYLSGAMQYAEDLGTVWRKRVVEKMVTEIGIKRENIIDPCNKPFTNLYKQDLDAVNLERLDHLKRLGNWEEVEDIAKWTIHLDLRFVDKADIIYAHVDPNVFTAGTIDEIITARTQKKPVILVVPGGLQNCPYWLLGRVGWRHIFPDDESAIQYLKDIREGKEPFDPRSFLFYKLGDNHETKEN